MRKIFYLALATLFLSGCSLGIKKSGIEVITFPTAKVIINGKEMGNSPYKNNSMTPGEVEVKLITEEKAQWSKKIHLENGANTVINQEINAESKKNGGYILYFESTGDTKKSGLLINSKPDKVAVAVDGEIKGLSPMRIDDIGSGDKQVTLSFPGYRTIEMFVRSVPGYQLVVEAELASEEVLPTDNMAEESSSSAQPTNDSWIMIKSTETGWLRARKEASANSEEVTKVKPGEKYKLLEENNEWYKIDLNNNKSAWVSIKYAEKI